jgi:hypothetical protein
MSLPVLTAPLHDIKLLSLPKTIQYRPYLVKEEKLFLMAQASGDVKDIERAVHQVVTNCTLGTVDATKLPSFDLEYLFLQLRARSVSNQIDLRFTCQHLTGEGVTCGTVVPVSIDIDDIKLTIPEGHANTFWLSEDIGVSLKYPTSDVLNLYASASEAQLIDVLAACLATVFTKAGDVYEAESTPNAELLTFVESLSLSQVEQLRVFFDTMPRIEHTFPFVCPTCGFTDNVTLSGLQDFFD